jgi:putative oxidoreductase
MKKYILLVAVWIVAIQFTIFGANKFLLFFNAPPPNDAQALAFMQGMFGSYLGKLVGLTEIVGSLLLVFPRTRFMGLLLLIPVMLNIVLYHLAHDNPGNMIWIVVLAIFSVVIYSQKNNFQSLIKIQDNEK